MEDLYTLKTCAFEPPRINATILLNPTHAIFKGHFPSQPVLPGVCILEMLNSVINKAMDRTYRLSSASMIKYLKVVDPNENGELFFTIQIEEADGIVQVVASSTLSDQSVNFKFKGSFV